MEAIAAAGLGVRLGGHHALVDVDLRVATGQRVALVGASGAGKTTLLRALGGAVAPTAGTLHVLGADLVAGDDADRRAAHRRTASIPQHLALVGPLRVVHNVNAGRLGGWSRRRALRSLVRPVDARVAQAALARTGVGHLLMERTDRLSGGEQQRVALARALVQEPDLVLADEPASSLDPVRADEVLGVLCEEVAGRSRTLVCSLHDLRLARRWCDRVVGLRHGRVAFDLPADDLADDVADALYRPGP